MSVSESNSAPGIHQQKEMRLVHILFMDFCRFPARFSLLSHTVRSYPVYGSVFQKTTHAQLRTLADLHWDCSIYGSHLKQSSLFGFIQKEFSPPKLLCEPSQRQKEGMTVEQLQNHSTVFDQNVDVTFYICSSLSSCLANSFLLSSCRQFCNTSIQYSQLDLQ